MATGGPGKRGRPKEAWPQEQIDAAKRLLGRLQYPSKVATRLAAKFALSNATAYRLIDDAQREVLDSLRGQPGSADPLAATYLFLQSVVGSGSEATKDRVAAANAVIKLLGLNKLFNALGDGDAEAFLAGVLGRKAAGGGAE